MALSARSVATAAKLKAERASRKLRTAEQELAKANQELQQAIPADSAPVVARAAKRTIAAEKDVHDAAEEVEAVKTLLDDVPDDDPHRAGRRSGEGSKSVLPHLRKNRDAGGP
jgi:hypothetical protein